MNDKIRKILSIRSGFILLTIINLMMLLLECISKKFFENNNKLVFIIFSIWCTLALYYLIYEAMMRKKGKRINEHRKSILIILVISIQSLLLYYMFYLGYEKMIRFWDYALYWASTVNNGNIFEGNVIKGIGVLIKTIFNDEYNAFPPIFIQSIFSMFQKSKWDYILSVFIVYTIPVIVCFATIFSRNINYKKKSEFNIKLIIGIIIVTFSPGLNLPTLIGYIDIVGLVFISIILVIMNDYDFLELDLKSMALIGISLILLFVARRWYVYWIIGYFIALGICFFITDICIEKQYRIFLTRIKNIFILGAALLGIVLIFLFPVIKRIIQSNFSFAYSAYKFGGISYEIIQFIKSLGIIPTAIMIIGIIISIKAKEKRNFSLILFIIPVICIVLFNFIQTMGIQHRYLLLPSALYFQAVGGIWIFDSVKKAKLQSIVGFGVAGIYILNFIVSINSIQTKNLFTNTFCEPIIMESYNENGRIAEFIEEKYKNTGEKTYILASSPNYNDSIIAAYYMPDLRIQNMIYNVNCIDLRDGFPEQFLAAKYVIVIDPIQYHMRPENQRTIGILAEAVLNESVVSKHYLIENIQKGSDGEKIYFLKQETPLDDDAKQFFINEFNKYYKQYPDLFENRIIKNIKIQ